MKKDWKIDVYFFHAIFIEYLPNLFFKSQIFFSQRISDNFKPKFTKTYTLKVNHNLHHGGGNKVFSSIITILKTDSTISPPSSCIKVHRCHTIKWH